MSNKWIKWVMGFGSISAFTLFLQTISTSDETVIQKESYASEETNAYEQQQEQISATTIEEREQQLMALDWTEGNWDVNYSKDAMIATPNADTTFLDGAEQRTRRS